MPERALKRQNFNVTPEEEAEIQRLREALGAASVKDALLRATRVVLTLSEEVQQGRRVYSGEPGSAQTRLLLPDIEAPHGTYRYLTARPHSWKRQLFVKGRRLTAANVWYDMQANGMSLEEAAVNWELPMEAVGEIIRYCEANRPLLKMESEEELRALEETGIPTAVRT